MVNSLKTALLIEPNIHKTGLSCHVMNLLRRTGQKTSRLKLHSHHLGAHPIPSSGLPMTTSYVDRIIHPFGLCLPNRWG